MSTLLGSNSKLSKSNGSAYLVQGLPLAPSDLSGKNLCPHSTAGCRQACVGWFAGRTVTSTVRKAMLTRTRMFFDDRVGFMGQLENEIAAHNRKAEKLGAIPAIRLNVFSDIVWEKVAPDLFTMFPKTRFYDYTKNGSRVGLPENYELTYSVNESIDSTARAMQWLHAGRNVAAVFDVMYQPQQRRYGALPKRFLGQTVIDGDFDDVRLSANDGRGVVVGLRLKGTNAARAAARSTGFAQATAVRLTIGGAA